MDMVAVIKAINASSEHGNDPTPMGVYEAAKNPDSILHAYFEWNVDAAVLECNLARARKLIERVRYVGWNPVVHKPEFAPYSNYVRDPYKPRGEQGYLGLDALKSTAIKDQRDGQIKTVLSNLEFARTYVVKTAGQAGVFNLDISFEDVLLLLDDRRTQLLGLLKPEVVEE